MSEWISVEDRLPKYACDVICYHKITGRFIGWLELLDPNIKDCHQWNNWEGERGIVPPTHWMPLPEPPK